MHKLKNGVELKVLADQTENFLQQKNDTYTNDLMNIKAFGISSSLPISIHQMASLFESNAISYLPYFKSKIIAPLLAILVPPPSPFS
jgi:hypothetical protein